MTSKNHGWGTTAAVSPCLVQQRCSCPFLVQRHCPCPCPGLKRHMAGLLHARLSSLPLILPGRLRLQWQQVLLVTCGSFMQEVLRNFLHAAALTTWQEKSAAVSAMGACSYCSMMRLTFLPRPHGIAGSSLSPTSSASSF